jgi:hypothetical protein
MEPEAANFFLTEWAALRYVDAELRVNAAVERTGQGRRAPPGLTPVCRRFDMTRCFLGRAAS